MMKKSNLLSRGVLMPFFAVVICLMLAGSVQSAPCEATGDFNGSGHLSIADLTELIALLYMNGGPSDPIYAMDLNADCIIDTLDIVELVCMLYIFEDCPSPPIPTCCNPTIWQPGQIAAAIGGAEVTGVGDSMIVVNNIGTSGDDGVRIYVGEGAPPGLKSNSAASTGSSGITMGLSNVDMAIDNASIIFEILGEVDNVPPGKSSSGTSSLGLVGMAGVVNNGTGSLQIIGDFNPIGDPEVFVKVYQGGNRTGETTVPGGGVIAWGTDAGYGLPQVLYVSFFTAAPTSAMIYLDRITKFSLVGETVFYGDEIHLIARNATKTVTSGRAYDIKGSYFGWFGITGINPDACCRGFTGNADCDWIGAVDIGDVTEIIRLLFINVGEPFCCEDAANLDYVDPIDIGDLSILINRLFITVTATPLCPQ